MNAFLETHPIYTIREALDDAMEAITREWSRRVQGHRVSTHESNRPLDLQQTWLIYFFTELDLLYEAALLSGTLPFC